MISKEILRQMYCLDVLTDPQLETLASIAEIQTYDKNTYVERENEICRGFYIVHTGKVSIEINLPIEQRVSIYIVKPGDLFGWSAVVAPHTVTASSLCMEPCEFAVIPKAPLHELLENDMALKASVMEMVTHVMRHRLKDTRMQMSYLLGG